MSVDHVDHECLVPLQTFHTEHALKPVPEFTSSFLMSWVFFLNIAYGTNLSCSTVDLTCKCIGVNEHMIKINGVLFQHC